MAERPGPNIFSIAAHRGFADALVAGLVPRYRQEDVGLARLTLLLPSTRAVRTVSEAFIRHSGSGLLMPRMVVVGDLDLDEALGALLDPIGTKSDIPPAAEPTRRWLRLSELIVDACGRLGRVPPHGVALFGLAEQIAAAMDRLLVEDIAPDRLWSEEVLQILAEAAGHWTQNTKLLAIVQQLWLVELSERREIDAAARRNRLFDHAARRWKAKPPQNPIVAAGVTSAAPALARLLRVVSDLPDGAVILPDLDLEMDAAAWEELGQAGAPGEGGTPFGRSDAVTHPQYHLKLLLNRMGISREEVRAWHRAGMTAAAPERSRAISSLFLPPEASAGWVDLPADRRRLTGVRLMETANPEEEAQAISLLIREALEVPEKRIALVTPDRGLASRVVAHLRRWNIEADDSAGRALPQTAAGRVFLLLAEVMAERAAPVPLLALLQHPLVQGSVGRAAWLEFTRALELKLRGPRPAAGLDGLRSTIALMKMRDPKIGPWWAEVEAVLSPLLAIADAEAVALGDVLDLLAASAETLCGDAIWAREDGRALSSLVEDLRDNARALGTRMAAADLAPVLRGVMERLAVRPPYGGHPRVAIYGLLESRMSRADLVICGGLNEGTWPRAPAQEPLLAPAILRALGVPGPDFRIGLAAHDLAGALGAPEVVLSRASRGIDGPAIPSRFLLRVRALMGTRMAEEHAEKRAVALARSLDDAPPAPPYERPRPMPNSEQRKVDVSVTALDRLRSDPYQFYAHSILRLRSLDAVDAEPSAAWKGTAAHKILQRWHESPGLPLRPIAEEVLEEMNSHPLMRALWRPRLLAALEWVEAEIARQPGRSVLKVEVDAECEIQGVRIHGRADRIDRLQNGELAIVDYKTGTPPSGKMVEEGFALQLGVIGLLVQRGGIVGIEGEPSAFEYWALGKSKNSETGFGYIETPVKVGRKRTGIPPEDFLPRSEMMLKDALDRWIVGDEPFTARLNPDLPSYADYDQLMRLDEWIGRGEEPA